MSTMDTSRPPKRKHAPTDSAPSSKRQRGDHTAATHRKRPAKANPINPLRKRLRDLQRLYNSPAAEKLPADVRQTHEREIVSLNSQIASAREDESRKRCITKYHMVRFFERRKAERRMKRAKKAVAEAKQDAAVGADEFEALEKKLRDAEVDLAYPTYYPLEVAYLSLYRDGEGDDGEISVNRGEMWGLVQEAMKAGDGDLKALRMGRWKERYAHLHPEPPAGASKVPKKERSKVQPKKKSEKNSQIPIGEKETPGEAAATVPEITTQDEPKDPRMEEALDVPRKAVNANATHEPRRIRRARERGERIKDPKYAKAYIPPPIPDDDGDRDGKGMDFFEM